MSRAFAVALRTLHADPSFGAVAEYRAGGVGAGISVRVVLRQMDEDPTGLGGVQSSTSRLEADIPRAEIPGEVRAGDTLTIGGTLYRIASAPADVDRLTFRARLTR